MFTYSYFQEMLHARPFEPFRVVTSSGAEHEVRHPEMAWVTKQRLYIGKPSRRNSNVPDSEVHVSLLHITEVQMTEAPARKGS